MTLVELMVVVMIMVILLGIAVPLMKPQLADRRIREASRQLNAFIAAAQARAAASGRSVGVWFARTDNTDASICYQVYFAESPAPYVGDTTSARAAFTIVDISDPMTLVWQKWTGVGKLSDSWSSAINGGDPNKDLISPGDLIQFNLSGPFYHVTRVEYNAAAQLTEFEFEAPSTDPHSFKQAGAPRHLVSLPGGDGVWGNMGDDDMQNGAEDANEIGWPGSDDALKHLTFQIIRKPQRATADSLSLPNGTAVILSASGMTGLNAWDTSLPMPPYPLILDQNEFHAVGPVIVMFRPDGSVERVYYGTGTTGALATSSIHFLVGSSIVDERSPVPPGSPAPASPSDVDSPLTWQNLSDLNNLWVTVHDRTGTVTTAQNVDWQETLTPADSIVDKTNAARSLTRTAQSVGGK
jgi:type II secretory pathway pseudopilin PulG